MPDERNIGSNARAMLIAQGSRFAIQFLGVAILSRLLQPADFGVLAVVAAVMTTAGVFGDLGMSLAAIRAPHLTRSQWTALFWINAGMGAVLTAVVAAASPAIAGLLGDPGMAKYILAVSPVFLLDAASVQYRVQLNRDGRFVALGVVETVPPTIAVFGAVALALVQPGPWPLIVQQVLTPAVLLLTAVLAVRRAPGIPRRNSGVRPLVQVGGALGITQIITVVSANIGAFALGPRIPAATVGQYSQAGNIARLPHLALGASLTRVVVPTLAGFTERSVFEGALHKARAAYTFSAGLVIASVGGMAAPVVLLLIGSQWLELTPTLVTLWCLAVLLQSVSYTFFWGLVAAGRTALQLAIDGPVNVAIIVGAILVAPRGAVWVTAVYVGAFAVQAVVYLVLATRALGIGAWDYAAKAIPSWLALAAVMGGGAAVTHVTDGLPLVARLAAGLAWTVAAVVGSAAVSRRVRSDLGATVETGLSIVGLPYPVALRRFLTPDSVAAVTTAPAVVPVPEDPQ